jgi:glycine/D-amino acid oxidase-like deaminating enzyme
MMKIQTTSGLIFFLFCASFAIKAQHYDIVVYGGTSAGVIAAYSAAKMGKRVIMIEPGNHAGGLSAGSLGFTDIGNKYAISGLALDFYRQPGKHYELLNNGFLNRM